jgi:hypothetical protein
LRCVGLGLKRVEKIGGCQTKGEVFALPNRPGARIKDDPVPSSGY